MLQLLTHLTKMQKKVAAYAEDFVFFEGVEDLKANMNDASFVEVVNRVSFILIRPDTIVQRRLRYIFEFLATIQIEIVSVISVDITPSIARLLWHYQWNVITVERSRVADLLNAICSSLILIVRPVAILGISTSEYISSIKGSAENGVSDPTSLRGVGGAQNSIFCAVHTPDEPADVVRELALLLRPSVRVGFFSKLDALPPLSKRELEKLWNSLYETVSANELTRETCLGNILSQMDNSDQSFVRDILKKENLDLSDIDALVDRIPHHLYTDLALVLSFTVPLYRSGESPTLNSGELTNEMRQSHSLMPLVTASEDFPVGFSDIFWVPDSEIADVILILSNVTQSIPIVMPREDAMIAAAAGTYLGGGCALCVLGMQGFATCIDVLTSLCIASGIPVVILSSWTSKKNRGVYHKRPIGEAFPTLLRSLNINPIILRREIEESMLIGALLKAREIAIRTMHPQIVLVSSLGTGE